MTVYFAWVDLVGGAAPAFSSAHHVQDEDVFSFVVSHAEGEFPQLSIEVRNEGVGLLSPGRKRWAWLSRDLGAGPVPLFFGRVVGTPDQIAEGVQRLLLIARPFDWREQKDALADSLRTLPQYDPIWIGEDSRNDPDVVLQARSAMWHTDRLTGEMTISDHIVGESGPLAVNHYRDGLQTRFVTAANRKVRVRGEVIWEQSGFGTVDITEPLLVASRDAGSPYSGMIGTYTGEGLIRDWPEVGTRIGGGWEVGQITLTREDGKSVGRRHLTVNADDGTSGRFPLWAVRPTMEVTWVVSRQYVETVTFEMSAEIQPLIVGADEDDPLEIVLQSSAVSEPIDGVVPIEDLRRRSYFQTDRGINSIQYLVERARATLRAQARAVEVAAEIPFSEAIQLSCRHSATITDPRLPGGVATGKVVAYSFGIDGATGDQFGSVSIGCCIGTDGSLSATPPSSGYFESGYADSGYDLATGQITLDSADTAWGFEGSIEINDDGVILEQIDSTNSILSFTAANLAPTQAAALGGSFADVYAAAEAMNEVPTTFALEMVPLDGLSFQTDYTLLVEDLVLPRQIDLEAA
jgi:hypothetical protein